MAYIGKFRKKMRIPKVLKIIQEFIGRNSKECHTDIYLRREMEETKLDFSRNMSRVLAFAKMFMGH